MRVFEHAVVAGSCCIHWPGEYPPTSPSPHSLNISQVSRYGNWTVCNLVGESGGKNNACNANGKPPSWVRHPPAGSVYAIHTRACTELKNAHNFLTVQNRTRLYKLFWSQRLRKSPPAVMSTSRETPCVCVCVCARARVHTHTHTHIHIYIYTFLKEVLHFYYFIYIYIYILFKKDLHFCVFRKCFTSKF
jgi:hypothetical protein